MHAELHIFVYKLDIFFTVFPQNLKLTIKSITKMQSESKQLKKKIVYQIALFLNKPRSIQKTVKIEIDEAIKSYLVTTYNLSQSRYRLIPNFITRFKLRQYMSHINEQVQIRLTSFKLKINKAVIAYIQKRVNRLKTMGPLTVSLQMTKTRMLRDESEESLLAYDRNLRN